MLKLSSLAFLAAMALAACAGHQDMQAQTSTAAAAPMQPAPQAAPAPAPPTTAQTSTASGTYTDAQLRSFAAASREIDPLNHQLTTATPAQRTAVIAQIRDILQRHNIDSATYNAIAAQTQTDPALAARIAAMNTTEPPPG
jgi:hypothetical protein